MSRALDDRGPHAIEARETLVNLYKIQGRYREAERVVREGADLYPDRIGLLKELAQLGSINPHKLDRVRSALEKAMLDGPGRRPGLAGLGQPGDADRAGTTRRRVGWTVAAGDAPTIPPSGAAVWLWRWRGTTRPGARDALRHLAAGAVEPAEVLELRAWFAAGAGDTEREEQALRLLVARSPDRLPALERLAELQYLGRAGRGVGRPRARKADLDRAKAQYEVLLFGPDAASRPAQLARLAESLGRRLEARILWTMAAGADPRDRAAAEGLARIENIGASAASDLATRDALLAELDRAGPRRRGGSRWSTEE